MQLPPGVDGSIDPPTESMEVEEHDEDSEVSELIEEQGDEVIGASEENE
jgi:hypothetical protein